MSLVAEGLGGEEDSPCWPEEEFGSSVGEEDEAEGRTWARRARGERGEEGERGEDGGEREEGRRVEEVWVDRAEEGEGLEARTA